MKINAPPKTLLTFAHRGEAQEFIKKGKFKAAPFYFDGLYQAERELLLLTGEGLQSTTEKTSAVCAAYRDEISMLINFGISASLDPQITIDTIYSIRTVYAEKGNQVAFKTFSSEDSDAAIDCLSANNRVLEPEYARHLSAFAPVVDRELWACASICELFKLPFRSYKLISDMGGDGAICPDIKDRALEFSERLYRHYCQLRLSSSKPQTESTETLLLPEGFYITTTQKRQLKSLLKNLQVKYKLPETEIINRIQPQQILETEKNAKKRTAIAIAALSNLLNPFNAALKNRLDIFCTPLTDSGCQVHFTRDYEDDKIDLSIQIRNEAHLNKFKTALDGFDYAEVVKILNGEME